MHPPTFRYQQRLSDWPDCSVEVRCPHCRHVVIYPVPILMRQGDRTFLELTRTLKCSSCGKMPAPVYLCAGRHRTPHGGSAADWAVEVVPPPPDRPDAPAGSRPKLRVVE